MHHLGAEHPSPSVPSHDEECSATKVMHGQSKGSRDRQFYVNESQLVIESPRCRAAARHESPRHPSSFRPEGDSEEEVSEEEP